MTFTLYAKKETPGTMLYAEGEREDGGKSRTFYLPKADWRKLGCPTSITITIQPA